MCYLIEETKEPKWYLVPFANLNHLASPVGIGIAFGLRFVAHHKAIFSLHAEVAYGGPFYQMAIAQLVEEESFVKCPTISTAVVAEVHEVGILHKYVGWLLIAGGVAHLIEQVDEARVLKIDHVVHHRGAAGVYGLSQLGNVWLKGCLLSHEVEQLTQFGQQLDVDLLYVAYLNLQNQVDGLHQIYIHILLSQEIGGNRDADSR